MSVRGQHPRHGRVTAVVALTVVTLAASGCGNRLAHDEIVAAAGGDGAVGVAGQDAADGAVGGTGTSPVGGAQAGDGLTPGGSAAGGAAGVGTAGTAGSSGSGGGPGAEGSVNSSGGNDAGAPPAAAGSPILLGNIGTYSGPVGASTASSQTMLKVWEAYVNDNGGINGHPVKIISADDQSDPAKTQAIARDMVENKKVVAFLGNQTALTAEAPRAYLESKNIPLVGGDLTSVWHKSPVYFAQGTFFEALILGIPKTGADFGKKNLGLLYCAEAAACKEEHDLLFANGGAASQGMAPKYSAQISLAQPDFTSECISARNAGVDAMSVAADANTVIRVANSCARQGFKPTFINAGGTVSGAMESNPNLEGMIATQNVFPWPLATGPGATYQAAIKRYAPGLENNAATTLVWTSGQLFARALDEVGPGPVTSQVVFESMWRLRDETVGGLAPPLTFPKGEPSAKATCYFVQQIIKGRWTASDEGKSRCLR